MYEVIQIWKNIFWFFFFQKRLDFKESKCKIWYISYEFVFFNRFIKWVMAWRGSLWYLTIFSDNWQPCLLVKRLGFTLVVVLFNNMLELGGFLFLFCIVSSNSVNFFITEFCFNMDGLSRASLQKRLHPFPKRSLFFSPFAMADNTASYIELTCA